MGNTSSGFRLMAAAQPAAGSVAGYRPTATDIRAAAQPVMPPRSDTVRSDGQDANGPEYRAKAAAAAEKFEAHFIAQVLKQMRRSVRDLNDTDERSFASRVNDDLLEVADTYVADALAHQRAFGIADLILRQLLPNAGPGGTAPAGGALKTQAVSAASSHETPGNE